MTNLAARAIYMLILAFGIPFFAMLGLHLGKLATTKPEPTQKTEATKWTFAKR